MNKFDSRPSPKFDFHPHAYLHGASIPPMRAPELGDIHGAFGDSDADEPIPALATDPDAMSKAKATLPRAAMPMSTDLALRKNLHFDSVHWQATLPQRHYVLIDRDYERDYAPAYRFGHDQRQLHPAHRRFEDVEHSLATRWAQFKVQSRLSWQEAKDAVKDAWLKVTDE